MIKAELIKRGHTFNSDTDTEVLIHLIEDIHENGHVSLDEAVRLALGEVIGAYAIVVLSKENPNELICARKGSPIVLGVGKEKDEFFVASDATPIIEYTNNVIYLNDGEVAYIKNGTLTVKTIENQVKTPYIHELELKLEQLEKGGYVIVTNNQISMTGKGEERARQIVRRHRLAERLLTDVLGMKPDDVEKGACEFEHLLAPELTESICTLLGHPRLCPHGIKIPEGDCCKARKESFASAAFSLTKAKPMERYRVAYINTQIETRMQKLFQFNIVPGTAIMVSQRYPSFVVQCGNTHLAMEENIAKEIYVWRNEEE
jgi:Mn-dependent DtxR family transcriptional regulator/Fe2+ transport system protein FeoA